jgi:hypothetical protein
MLFLRERGIKNWMSQLAELSALELGASLPEDTGEMEHEEVIVVCGLYEIFAWS